MPISNSSTIILIGNYLKDRQESMERFARMLEHGFSRVGYRVEIWQPVTVFGSLFDNTCAGIRKWFGYIDKWVLFPMVLRWRVFRISQGIPGGHQARYHICDHSNAPYLPHLPAGGTSITCHDVLAIRGALGDNSVYCPASRTGVILQQWILKHLVQSRSLAAVTQSTITDLRTLANREESGADWRVIPNGFNNEFRRMESEEAWDRLAGFRLSRNQPYILHVGSSHPRKNRGMLVEMVAVLGKSWTGQICFAGMGLDPKEIDRIKALGLEDRVVSMIKPDHETLVALYSSCFAFIFPSHSEGFGWPVIEAQACGAPVIASNRSPMPEVSGGKALHANPDDPKDFAGKLLVLQDPETRQKLVHQGLENCQRYETGTMINAYLDLFGLKPIPQA